MLAQSTLVGVHMHIHMRIRAWQCDIGSFLWSGEIKAPAVAARGRSALAL